MPLCADCEKIETGRRGAPGHGALKEMSHSKQNWGTGVVITTKFTCQVCGAKWEYENDKHDKGAGWSPG
ncbi:hypothetical protein D9M72_638160 [compost metagenome]